MKFKDVILFRTWSVVRDIEQVAGEHMLTDDFCNEISFFIGLTVCRKWQDYFLAGNLLKWIQPQMKGVRKFCFIVSGLLAVMAGCQLGLMLVKDCSRNFVFDAQHLTFDAPPILLIGLAFVFFQFTQPKPWKQRIRSLLLGAAFAIWGSESFLPNAPWVTGLDELAMSIFVIDLGFIIFSDALPARVQKKSNEHR